MPTIISGNNHNHYDCTITGVGIASLSLAIQLTLQGMSVAIFELESAIQDKSGGAYISEDSKNLLLQIGISLEKLFLPQLNQLLISAVSGNFFKTTLPFSSSGISSQFLNTLLYQHSLETGVKIFLCTKVISVKRMNGLFVTTTSSGSFTSEVSFDSHTISTPSNFSENGNYKIRKNKVLTIKYFLNFNFPENEIHLHTFTKSFCKISNVENKYTSISYNCSKSDLSKCGNDLKKYEKENLFKNPFLDNIFKEVYKNNKYSFNLSEIKIPDHGNSFENFFLENAGGIIDPIFDSGLSGALQFSIMAFKLTLSFFRGEISLEETVLQYNRKLTKLYGASILERYSHSLLENSYMVEWAITIMKNYPLVFKTFLSLSKSNN